MDNIKKVSIIIPHYNSVDSLIELINSIPNINDIEIIIVDDNSDENKTEINNIVLLRKKQISLYCNDIGKNSAGRCRNIGMQYATGKWIMFADADDYFLPSFWECLEKYLQSESDIVYFSPISENKIDDKKAKRHLIYKKLVDEYCGYPTRKNEVRLRYLWDSPWSKLVRRELIVQNNIRFDETLVANDVMFSMQVAHHARKISVSKEVIYCVTQKEGTLTTTRNRKNLNIRADVFIRKYKYLKKRLVHDEWLYLNLLGKDYINLVKRYNLKKVNIFKLYLKFVFNRVRVYMEQKWTIKYVFKKMCEKMKKVQNIIIDKFLLKDLGKSFKKVNVAFYIDDIKPYNQAMASIRMRCYDVILFFEKLGIHAELYKPFKKYKVVIFTKTSTDKSVQLAAKLKAQGVKIYYESFCEYLTDDNKITHEKENILETVKVADAIGACSTVQQEMFSVYHDNVLLIPESVHDDFFVEKKKHDNKKQITLVYCGYSDKAKDTLQIKEVIKKLMEKFSCKMLFICEKDPQITEFSYEFIKYDQRIIAKQLLQGDIMLAPRPMDGIEKRSHSFTKASYPLAVGLPTVASPLPSYYDTPVILCYNEDEWYERVKELITDVEMRQKIGDEGVKFVYENYSMEAVGKKYVEVLRMLKVIE